MLPDVLVGLPNMIDLLTSGSVPGLLPILMDPGSLVASLMSGSNEAPPVADRDRPRADPRAR